MVIAETEEVITAQRVREHKGILDMIALLDKRLSKVEDAVPVTLLVTLENLETRLSKIENDDKGTARNAIGDKSLLSKLNMDVADNRADLYYVQDELRHHCKDAHISQGQVKKWIYEKIEETTNGKN